MTPTTARVGHIRPALMLFGTLSLCQMAAGCSGSLGERCSSDDDCASSLRCSAPAGQVGVCVYPEGVTRDAAPDTTPDVALDGAPPAKDSATDGGSAKPDQGIPDQGIPDQGIPDQGIPDQGIPDLGIPDLEAQDGPTDDGRTDSDSRTDSAPGSDGQIADRGPPTQ